MDLLAEKKEHRNAFVEYGASVEVMECIVNAIRERHGEEKEREILNKKDSKDQSPLYYFVAWGRLQAVEWLVNKKNAEMMAPNKDGLTPLHALARNEIRVESSKLSMAKILLETPRLSPKEKREYLLAKCKEGKNAIDYAKEKKLVDVLEYLQKLEKELE